MTETEIYKLKKPAQSDYYNVDDFNTNADLIEAALKDLEDRKAELTEDGKVPSERLPDMSAKNISYDNEESGIEGVNVQVALDELASKQVSFGEDGKIDETMLPSSVLTTDTIGQPGGAASLGEDGKVPAAQLPEISSVAAVSATLTTSGWALGSDDRYAQTVSVSGVTASASQVIVVDVALTGTDLDADTTVLEAWQGPSAHNVAQRAGTLTFYAYEVPSVNIPINVGVA